MTDKTYRPYRGRSQRASFNRKPRGKKTFKKDYIDPSRFVRAAKVVEAIPFVPTHQFTDFPAHPTIIGNLQKMGFEKPTPIQDQAIPLGLQGSDIVGIANTGTGKTTAFAVPVLHRLLSEPESRAIILAPTRELAQQIEKECRAIGRKAGFFGALLIGGSSMGEQLRDLRRDPKLVIGTPGRVKDHLERGTLQLSRFNIAVLDEVDRMLDMGFINDIRFILDNVSDERQSFFFSATLDGKVGELMHGFLRNPQTISVKTGDTSDTIEQNVVRYQGGGDRLEKLHDLLNKGEVAKAIIFDDTQKSVERLGLLLQDRGFSVDAIHGGKTQGQRQRALRRFTKGEVTILVATDVAARGIDVQDVTHVINYSTPQSYEDYVHRIGRAGRAGRIGYALTFIQS